MTGPQNRATACGDCPLGGEPLADRLVGLLLPPAARRPTAASPGECRNDRPGRGVFVSAGRAGGATGREASRRRESRSAARRGRRNGASGSGGRRRACPSAGRGPAGWCSSPSPGVGRNRRVGRPPDRGSCRPVRRARRPARTVRRGIPVPPPPRRRRFPPIPRRPRRREAKGRRKSGRKRSRSFCHGNYGIERSQIAEFRAPPHPPGEGRGEGKLAEIPHSASDWGTTSTHPSTSCGKYLPVGDARGTASGLASWCGQ